MKKAYLLSFLLLSACATNEILYTDANGVTVYKAQCDQAYALDMSDCIKLMSQQCPFGFNIMMANEQQKGLWSSYQTNGNLNTNTYANAHLWSAGNNVFANGYSNSQSNLNMNTWGGVSASYSRFILYTCKNPVEK